MSKTKLSRRAVLTALAASPAAVEFLRSAVAEAQQSSLSQSGLVGEIQGPTMITDPAKWPKKFSEAPMLAELVKAGKLPPVEQRIPAEPMVWQPLDQIGIYGGTWRRAFTGPGDGENGNRIQSSDKPLHWSADGSKIVPCVAKGYELSDDGKTYTLFLRKGMKWSDGSPFTADDFMFWFQDIYSNPEIVPTPTPEMRPQGKPGRMVKVDETTVRWEWDVPYYLFEEIMAGDTAMGGGQAVRQAAKVSFGAYAPGHYLKQFLPKYSSVEAVNARAKQEGFENWVQMLHFKKDWELNSELPVLGPWRSVRPINNPIWLLERNPYYYAVDTTGNQLPYFDKVQFTLAENLEVINLRAMAGEYDEQERHIDLGKLPVLLDNQQKGNYKVHLDLGFAGSDFMFHVNQSYTGDAEVRKWLTNADFRRALALGIDRDQLNETFWLGVGTPGSPAPGESMPQSPGPEWRKKWSTYDPATANKMLDSIGLAKKDADGFRVRTDNGDRLRIQVIAIAAFLPYPKLSEMVADQWRKIGIQADVKEMERGLGFAKQTNNEHQLFVWNNGGTELLYLFPTWAIPVIPGAAFGPAYADWYSSGGKQGTKPDDANIMKIFDLYTEAAGLKAEGRNHNAQEIWKILVDQQYGIGTVGQSPAGLGVRLVSNRLGNIASRVCNAQHCRTPGNSHPETWYFKA
jgi:peptide/nickel transport system substrate-binding protein